jgi:enterochelin esterase-like enzyme
MKLLLALSALFAAIVSSVAQDAVPSPAQVTDNGRVAFTIRAPDAKEVKLQGQWSKEGIAMTKGEKEEWAVTIEKVPAGVWEYSFSVDGLNVLDARNPALKPQRQPGKSILHVPSNPPAPWDWQDVPHGTVHTHGYLSKVLGRAREVVVYTPPGYEKDAAKKYPLLVLQHGSGDNQRTWVEHGKAHWIFDNLIAQGKAQPMVVMMIDGHPHGMVGRDAADTKRISAQEAFERELLDDAMPLVESIYRVEKDPANRAIAGLSMGGAQSLSVGLMNMDRVAWVIAMSAGPPSAQRMEKFLADPAAANAKLKLLWIGVGKNDFLLQRSEQLTASLKEKGIKHEWRLTEGDHSWPVWRGYLAEVAPLLFAKSGH